MRLLKGNMLAQMVMQSDIMTKIVLATLLFVSIVCWSIFFYKFILFYVKRRQLKSAIHYLEKVNSLEDIRNMAVVFAHTLPGYFIARNLAFVKSILETKVGLAPLTERELNLIQLHVDQKIEDIMHHEESSLPILSGTAAIAPLLGLFGTIWGLIHSFLNISETQQADIATIAPGIAEALITTLAGLLVAIPVLAMFYYLNMQVKHIEKQLFDIADKLNWIIQMISR